MTVRVEVSAYLRPSDTPPNLVYPDGNTCEYLTSGAQSDGRFGLYRWTFGEEESALPSHHNEALLRPAWHGFTTQRFHSGWPPIPVTIFMFRRADCTASGGDYARIALSFAPGGPREDYFGTTARGDLDNMSDDERQAFMDRHDILEDLKLVSQRRHGAQKISESQQPSASDTAMVKVGSRRNLHRQLDFEIRDTPILKA